jgi:hypothetical protein
MHLTQPRQAVEKWQNEEALVKDAAQSVHQHSHSEARQGKARLTTMGWF